MFLSFFMLAIPPGWGLDEQSHVARAYQVSEGVLTPYLRDDARTLGAQVPQAIIDLQMDGHRASNSVDRGAPQWSRSDFDNAGDLAAMSAKPLRPEVTSDFDMSNAAASSAIAYAPAAAGIAVARALEFDTGAVLLSARFANAIVYLGLGFLGIRLLRGFRVAWLGFVMVLFPSAIVQASYVTADTYTNAITVLFVAAVARLCLDRDPPASTLLFAALAGVGVVFAKPSYAILLAVVLAVPATRVLPHRWRTGTVARDRRRAHATRWGYLGVASLVTALLLFTTSSVASAISAMYGRGAEPAEQLRGVLGHPLETILVMVRSVVVSGDFWARSLFGSIGYNGVNLPEIAAVGLVALVVVASLNGEVLGRIRAASMVAIAVGAALVSMLALYLSFTPVGSSVVDGVQGRYFVPILFPFLLGARSLLPMRAQMSPRASAVVYPIGAITVLGALAVTWILALY